MKPLACLCLLTLTAFTGCSKDATSVTSPSSTTATTSVPILFSGTLEPRATRFYSYTLTTSGTVSALLASVERNGRPTTTPLELGIGVPAGTGCAVLAVTYGGPTLVPQIKQDFSTGTYCVRISDVDGLPQALTFTIRVIKP